MTISDIVAALFRAVSASVQWQSFRAPGILPAKSLTHVSAVPNEYETTFLFQ
jgi:hypothetical protein